MALNRIDWRKISHYFNLSIGFLITLPRKIWKGGKDAYYWCEDLLAIWDFRGIDLTTDLKQMAAELRTFILKAIELVKTVVGVFREMFSQLMRSFGGWR